VNASADEIDNKISVLNSKVMSQPRSTLDDIKKIRLLHRDTLSIQQQVSLLGAETFAYLYSNNYQKTLEVINELEDIADKTNNDYFRWSAVNSKAILYTHMDKGQEALTFYLEALKILKNKIDPVYFESLNEKKFDISIAVIQNNIGYLSVQLGFYQEAIPFLEESTTFHLEQNKPSQVYIAAGYNNLGEAYLGLREYDKAFKLHKKALKIRLDNNLKFHASFSYHNLGLYYRIQKDFIKAKGHLLKAIDIRKENNFTKGILASQIELAKIYRDNNEPQAQEKLLATIIKEAIKDKKHTSLTDAYKMQHILFNEQKRFEKAYIASIKYQQTLEHINVKKNNDQLSNYLTNVSTVTKDLNIQELQKTNEIRVLQVANERQKSRLILVSGIIIALTLCLFLWLLQLKRKKIQVINNNLSSTLSELKSAQSELIESEKMSALTILVSGMAHQMNSPLGIAILAITHIKEKVVGFTELLSNRKIKKTDVDALISDLEEGSSLALGNVDRAAKLVTKFKMISAQLEENIQEQFDIITLLIQRSELLMQQVTDNRPTVNISGDEVILFGYPVALGKVLSHLVQNSIDHGFQEVANPKIDIEIQKKKNDVEIIYRDNGKGVDIKSISKIFDPFYTTNMGNKNIGIGLSVVYNIIVQLMYGTIVCEPSSNTGTLFRITLPLTES
jgi:signal transduction histidine kinase